MFEKSKMNYLEMYYPSCFIKFYGFEIIDNDTSILDNILDKCIAYIKFDVSSHNVQCLVIFKGENMYNDFISNLNKNNIPYKEDTYTYRVKTHINQLLDECHYSTNLNI